MFSYLRFEMENSLGIPVKVEIDHKAGLLTYGIAFGGENAKETKRRTMSKGNSDRFIRRWHKVSCNDLIRDLAAYQETQKGDYWQLLVKYDDVDLAISGQRPGASLFDSFIEPLMELLDDTFGITQFVKASRVDRLEIELFDPFPVPEELSFMEGSDECSHVEHVSLSRDDWILTYTRRFPQGCFHNSYECHCEGEIRQLLDQTSDIFDGGDLFKGHISEDDDPILTFTFHFHDGNQAMVNRSLSKEGTGSQVYDELLDVIGRTIECTVFGGGMFDPDRNGGVDESSETAFEGEGSTKDRYLG